MIRASVVGVHMYIHMHTRQDVKQYLWRHEIEINIA
jgi:hypothetical protein